MSGRPQAVPTVQVDNAEVIVTATATTMWWYR